MSLRTKVFMTRKMVKLMGKKRGMIQLFDDKGRVVPCTVIEVEPNVVTQVKTEETDGYNAIQLGFEEIKTKDPRTVERRVSKPLLGHFKKSSVTPRRYLSESRLENANDYAVGQVVGLDALGEVDFVDAIAVSKGKGYQGVIKRHNFAGGPASHGSGFHRHGGSTGMRSTPGRCLPGQKMAGHMGSEQKTVQNLRVVSVDAAENIIVVEGAVPGARNGLVYISPAIKRQSKVKK
ncbi:50S ribosomal protein L3 [Chlamydiales bacterium STE3]|nr:50S ribosomal protein L3 [Chlamydiales bacterium STE3]